MARHFTLDEAEALLPEVERSIRRAVDLKAEYSEAEQQIGAVARRIAMSGGALVNRQEMVELKARRDIDAARLKEAIEEIEQYGCLVKDLDTGLVDFPTLLRGETVLLCWKLGEPAIRFWHGAEEGFRGRKPIDREFLDNHKGDPAQ